MDRGVLEELVPKTAEFVPAEGHWRVFYLGFARGGWVGEAQTFAKTIGKVSGENWQAAGMSLVDLSQVDQDLREWTQSTDDETETPF